MRSEFDVNLTSQPSFRSDIRKWVEQSWTAANFLLRICDVDIRIASASAGSMNRALHSFTGRWKIHTGLKYLPWIQGHWLKPLAIKLRIWQVQWSCVNQLINSTSPCDKNLYWKHFKIIIVDFESGEYLPIVSSKYTWYHYDIWDQSCFIPCSSKTIYTHVKTHRNFSSDSDLVNCILVQ